MSRTRQNQQKYTKQNCLRRRSTTNDRSNTDKRMGKHPTTQKSRQRRTQKPNEPSQTQPTQCKNEDSYKTIRLDRTEEVAKEKLTRRAQNVRVQNTTGPKRTIERGAEHLRTEKRRTAHKRTRPNRRHVWTPSRPERDRTTQRSTNCDQQVCPKQKRIKQNNSGGREPNTTGQRNQAYSR